MIFVAYTMSNFEAMYRVYDKANIEQVRRYIIESEYPYDSEEEEQELKGLSDEEMLTRVGIEVKPFRFEVNIFDRAKAAIERYIAIAIGRVIPDYPKMKEWVIPFGYHTLTDNDVTFAELVLHNMEKYLDSDTWSGLSEELVEAEPLKVINKYMDIFCLEHKSAEFSIEANYYLEKALRGKEVSNGSK